MNNESEDIAVHVWKYSIPVLYLLIFVGAVFRIYNLGFNSLWLDEAATLKLSSGTLEEIWSNMAAGDFNPPLFQILEHFMTMIGTTEIALRLIPALFGIAAIPIMYLVGKEFKDKYIGIILAGLTTFSPFLISYSQEARAYSMMFFLGACMVLLFLRAMKTNKQTEWFLFAIVSAVAFWTHFYSVVLFIPLVIFAAYKFRNDWQPIGFSVVAWFAMAMPLLFALYNLVLMRASSAPTYGYQGFNLIVQTFSEIFWYYPIAMGFASVLFIIGIWWTYKNDKETAIFLLFVPALVFIISVFLSNTMPMLPRYLIFVNIFAFLGISMALPALVELFYVVSSDNLQRRTTRDIVTKAMSFLLIGCFIAAAIPFYGLYYQEYTKTSWKDVGITLTNATNYGDVVLVIPRYVALPLDYYYSSKLDNTVEIGINNTEELDQIKYAADVRNLTVFYIMTPDINAEDPSGNIIKWVAANTTGFASAPGVVIRTSGARSLPVGGA